MLPFSENFLGKLVDENAIKGSFSEFWHVHLNENGPRTPKMGLNFSLVKN